VSIIGCVNDDTPVRGVSGGNHPMINAPGRRGNNAVAAPVTMGAQLHRG
jgi:hypothetical protein